MEETEQQRVTEVFGALRGSGYLIAPGLVITALHVVLGKEAAGRIPADVRVDVRLFGDVIDALPRDTLGWDLEANRTRIAALKLPWRKATLKWPPKDTPIAGTDIALLELDTATTLPLPAGLRAVQADRRAGAIAGGFPAFAVSGRPETGIWELSIVEGRPDTTRQRSGRALGFAVTSDARPAEAAGWQGLSGAALWIDDGSGCSQLAGVMHAMVDGLESSNMLRYWPIDTIEPNSDFWTLAGLDPPTSAPAAPRQAKPLVAQLNDNFFRFDRDNATTAFRSWLRGGPPDFTRAGAPIQPTVLVLRGHRFDEPWSCAKRFAMVLADIWAKRGAQDRRAGDRGAPYREPIAFDCGPLSVSAANRIETLFVKWAKAYSVSEPDFDADLGAIVRAGLDAPDRPRAILIEHRNAEFGEPCREVIAAALAPLRTWQPRDEVPPPLVLLCLLTGVDGGPAENAYRPVECFAGKDADAEAQIAKLVAATPELEWYAGIPDLGDAPADLDNVDQWLADVARIEASALPAGLATEIRLRLDPHIEFPVGFARAAVERTAIAQRS